ncbi:hypothetical protein B0H13DRAFT_1007176 [Mycena leptocephala]|nr:hypothetical protein B0H13DRAFT_1007176 [Mycena leptocephala]
MILDCGPPRPLRTWPTRACASGYWTAFMLLVGACITIQGYFVLVICHSTTIDPRHLEHHTYTYWTGNFTALIVRGKLKYCLIAPQFPIYVSPKEPLDPDTSFGSDRTDADGEAQGVYVDIAIVMPIVQPRYVEELGPIGKELNNKSLHHFLDTFLPPKLPGLSPRCLWVSGFEAPLVGELKPGPTRHADKIDPFYVDLVRLLRQGVLQAEVQRLCLFCSWQFTTQEDALLLGPFPSELNFHYRKIVFLAKELPFPQRCGNKIPFKRKKFTLWQRDQKRTVMLGFVYLQNARNGKRLGQALFQIVARFSFTKQGWLVYVR